MKMLEEESREDYQYIDVRPAEQFNTLHVFGFQNIPLKQLKNDLKNLSKDKSVVVISERGNNSNEACRDRKSTRLNSSHVAISYAVFCLKKKKILFIVSYILIIF